MPQKLPLVSIITVCLNAEKVISSAIKSVINQTYQNIEYIIIDGGSTDSTLEIIKELDCNSIIKLLSEQDKGIYDAMNKGINYSIGEWIYFLGSDDLLIDENVVEDLFTNYYEPDIQFIYGNVIFKNSGTRYDGEFDFEKISVRNICHQAIFYNRNVFDELGYFDLNYQIYADHVFNIRCFGSNISKKFINRDIALYNELGISSKIIDQRFLRDLNELLVQNSIISKKSFDNLKSQDLNVKFSIRNRLGEFILYPYRYCKSKYKWLIQKF